MKSAIISVGTEILFGEITNTNSVYLAQQLNLLGIDVLYQETVGDNDARLRGVLERALSECDLIITTGGLGPTEDDMTKETIASVMEDVLVEHGPSMEALRAHEKKRNRKMTANNFKQAMMPSRATVFDNDAGTAPGFALEKDGAYIISMPGPPREMTRMFQRRVKPFLEPFTKDVIFYRTVRTFGIGESSLETQLLDLIDGQTDPTIATYAKEGECSVRIASKRATLEEAKAAVDEMVTAVLERVGEYVYSTDDRDLPTTVGELLIEKNLHISCAESATGGMFASELTSVAGISQVFDRGFVTYTEEAKMEELGVKEETLAKYTVYSENVAAEMAEGVANKTNSDVCVSITGIAGPGTPNPELPEGSAYIGVHYKGETKVYFHPGRGVNRNWNRHYMMLAMMNYVLRTIEK